MKTVTNRYCVGYAQHIKAQLVDYLLERFVANDIIIAAEVPVQGKMGIIDMMLIKNEKLVGFEIKSDFDSLSRLENQINVFNGAFHELYIVCGESVLRNCAKKVKNSVGILSFSGSKIQQIRQASQRKHLQKNKMVDYLWKVDIPLTEAKGIEGVENIRKVLAKNSKADDLEKKVIAALLKRYHSRYNSFMKARGQKTCVQDIDILTIQDDYLHYC